MVDLIEEGYDGRSVNDTWTFPNSLMFTLSVITTIGWKIFFFAIFSQILLKYFVKFRYGNTTPRSEYGKIVTMIYAVFGIPVYILYFQNIGKVGDKR